ncbi:hypothetical protein [Streptomyces lancefieldiae]|uniref:Uncharacterized protein n=1 Tax=Streptomyces lancefieldiae TaxID=3075520 RepID=A0ABU3AF59_9ACTN|nr:hypothetical protein [Streptomyces sp. DSM 40712]MDT0608811.1 hypothetical protein [Streptomyces sp. DSM 40712]
MTDQTTPLRDRITEALAKADGWQFRDGSDLYDLPNGRLMHYRDGADAVLAVLPATADQTTPLRDRIAAALMDLGHPQWDAAEGADAVLAVLPATTNHDTDTSAENADADTVANRAAQVISAMGADIRELKRERDRSRTAWHSARRRASVLSAEITRRAPLLGEYAAQIANLRTMYDASEARVSDLIDERDQVLETRTDRTAVLREAADAVFALEYDVMVGEEGDENMGSMREAWDVGTIHATQLLRRMADQAEVELRRMADKTAATETQAAEVLRVVARWAASSEGRDVLVEELADAGYRLPHACGNCEGIDPDTCLKSPDRPAVGARQDGARP